MNNTLKRAFAAVALCVSGAVATGVNAEELSTTPDTTAPNITVPAAASAAQKTPTTLEGYLRYAQGANFRELMYQRQFMRSLFEGISKMHVEHPSVPEIEKLALNGLEELYKKKQSYTIDEYVEAALDGVLKSLDPHSDYMNKKEWRDMQAMTTGKFAGLGVQVRENTQSGGVEIISPMSNGPAEKAGVLAGDVITHIDGQDISSKSFEDAMGMLRGAPGDPIDITIQRPGQSVPISMTIIREIIESSPVTARAIGDIGYIHISSFNALTTEKMEEAVDQLQKDIGRSLKGFVIDLRYNPGGLLNEAISVVDSFVESGGIVSTGDISGGGRNPAYATPGDITNGAPIVVLVNGGSASASEIVAGALQDNHRATIMGTQTFGKGSVQTVIGLGQHFGDSSGNPREDGLRVTIQLYYTPSGDTIQNKGVTPDIRTEFVGTASDGNIGVSEADMPATIANPNVGKDIAETVATCAASSLTPDTATMDKSTLLQLRDGTKEPDYQLLCAIEHLRNTSEYTVIAPIAPAPAP